ncbi:armadillo-type protein [Leucosporidium creatinivorum]|uniref:Armadillo-type protein n=1 Tax=Leucosporidium creatinivorum TaxID=106004 RepID=A0A1Y2FEM1_9BASI|nr:armadillo-type protein [Leucosporidium creatinivorum]
MSDFLTQLSSTLSSLASAGPERPAAEAHLNELIATQPGLTLLSLIQLGSSSSDEAQRVFSFVLFRRMAFRPLEQDVTELYKKEVWDVLAETERGAVQQALLTCLEGAERRKEHERGVICDAVAEVERAGVSRQTRWPALATTLSSLFSSPSLALREACFRIYTECISLLEAEPAASAVEGLSAGLRDESPGVRLAALAAAAALLKNAEPKELDQYAGLVAPMLNILPPLVEQHAESRLTTALLALIDLASTPKIPSRVFKPHLPAILSFTLSILTPSPVRGSTTFSETAMDETVRTPAIEFLLSIAETAPAMTKSYPEFVQKFVPALMQVMVEVEEDSDWLSAEVIQDDEDEGMAVVAESSLDRLARAMGKEVFPPFLEALAPLYQSSTWQHRHAALSAIAAVGEGCADSIVDQLHYFVNLATQAVKDSNPRVRYAAVFALGQLCTDLDGAVQADFGVDVLRALVTVARDRESRLQAFAAAGMVNFFQTAEIDESLEAVMPDVFGQLLSLLERGTNFVKGNALEAMTLLARALEEDFEPFYPAIFPQLLNLLETGIDPSLEELRAKALDCASHIGAAVDSSLFAPDAPRLLTIMHQIHVTIREDDEIIRPYLLTAFSLLAVTVGPEAFAPYVEDVFPKLLETAAKKTDAMVGSEDDEEEEGWETVEVAGQTMAIRTAGLEEKHDAVCNLILLTQAIGSSLPLEALQKILEVAHPLLKFYFHMGVRESAAALIAVSVHSLSQKNLSVEERESVLNTVSDAYAQHIATDTDAEMLGTLVESWTACCRSLPGLLSEHSRTLIIKGLEHQLISLRQRELERAQEGAEGGDEDDLLELNELAETEATLYFAINTAVKQMLKEQGPAMPVQPFLPFLQLVGAPSTVAKEFALRLLSDIIEGLGEESFGYVGQYLDQVLHALSDEEPTTRRIAAYAIGVAVEKAPQSYADVAARAVEPLFASIGEVDTSDNDLLLARDNSVSALSKIIRHSSKVNADALLPRWIGALPVFVDAEEMTPTNTLLLELMARNHPSIAPTSPVAPHIVKSLVSTLQSEVLPAGLETPLAQALKAYLGTVPGGLQQIPEDVQAKLSNLA